MDTQNTYNTYTRQVQLIQYLGLLAYCTGQGLWTSTLCASLYCQQYAGLYRELIAGGVYV